MFQGGRRGKIGVDVLGSSARKNVSKLGSNVGNVHGRVCEICPGAWDGVYVGRFLSIAGAQLDVLIHK
jgi:hypothetical protein